MTETDLFRALLDEQGIKYHVEDKPTYRDTWFQASIAGELFDVEFREPLDCKPGTLGAMRELMISTHGNATAEDSARVIAEVID